MRITQLEATNVKRLRAVSITPDPDGHMIVVGGANGAGKSSLIDSIEMALAGKSSVPSRPVRDGEESARIVCRLDGDRPLVVTRRFTAAGGTSLVVTNEEGAKFPSPQALLDELVGRLTFDPLAFSRMEPKRQLETLRSLVGLDTTDIDAKRRELYETRTTVSRDAKALESRLVGMQQHEGAPDEEISVAALMDELTAAQRSQGELEAARLEGAQAQVAVGRAGRAVEDAEAALAEARLAATYAQADLEKLRTDFASIRDAATDPAPIREQIANAEDVNRRVRENAAQLDVAENLKAARDDAQSLTDEITALDGQKREAISAAKFPVEGLAFGEDGITFGDLPFDQASSAEQLRVSVAMGLAMNPKLRVLLIRDGSLLDAESLRLLAEMAEEADAQVWMERVSDGEEVTVLIEDGSVVEPAEAADAAA